MLRKVSGFSQSVLFADFIMFHLILNSGDNKKIESNVTLYEGSPLKYLLIVAKPKERYLDSSNNNKATGAV